VILLCKENKAREERAFLLSQIKKEPLFLFVRRGHPLLFQKGVSPPLLFREERPTPFS